MAWSCLGLSAAAAVSETAVSCGHVRDREGVHDDKTPDTRRPFVTVSRKSRPSGDDGPTALNGRIGTASAHASTNVPLAHPDDSVVEVLAAMRGRRFDSAAVVAVCTHDHLVGLATVERLFAAPAESRMADVMDSQPPTVMPSTDQEHAAWQAVKHGEPGLAVVDATGRFAGLVLPHRLLGVLLEEHDEDLARLGGYCARLPLHGRRVSRAFRCGFGTACPGSPWAWPEP